MTLFHRAILRYAFSIMLVLCILIFPSCEKEHDELSFNNPMDPTNPVTHGDPYNVRVQVNDKGVTVQWDKLPEADGFVVYRSTLPDGDFEQIGTSTSSEYEDAEVPPGVTYYYQIRGYQGSKERQAVPSPLTNHSQAAIKSPPEVKLTSNYETWERGILKVEAQATDIDGDVQHVCFEYSLNGETWSEIATDTASPYTAEWDTTSVIETLDDSVWVKATAADNENLTSERAVDEPFGVDNEPPWIAKWYLTPDDVTEDTSGTLRVSVQVSDGNGSGLAKSAPQLEYRIGENTAYDGSKAMTMESKDLWRCDLPEPSQGWGGYRGEHIYYRVTLKDALGNEMTGEEQNELIDDINDPPSVLITASYDKWERGSLTVSAEASDDGGTVTVRFDYSLDKSNWIRIGSTDSIAPYSVTWDTKASVPEAAQTVWLRATATDDDRESTVYTIPNSFSIDNQPPTATHDYDGFWHKESFTIKLQADDYNGVGVGSVFYILNHDVDQERQINGQGSVSVSITREGSDNTLEYWCADKLGNESPREILSGVKLDRTAPVFSDWEQLPADLRADTSGSFRVSVRITDGDGSGLGDAVPQLDYRVGAGAQYDGYQDMTTTDGIIWEFDIPEPSDGWDVYRGESLYYKVSSVDVAGNVAGSAQQTELIDSTNEPPVITSHPVTTVTEDEPYSYNVESSDTDIGDVLTYALTSAPSGMNISPSTGIITWTPTNDHVGDHDVAITVSDGGNDGVASQSFVLHVINVNDPPVITSIAETEATEDKLYSYNVEASDPDTDDILEYRLITSPSGMNIDSATGVITWTPTNDDVNEHSVVVTVSDGSNGNDVQSFNITVANENDAPAITSTAVIRATEDIEYSYDVDATDPDVGDILTYSLIMSPSGMIIDSSTGMITWTPTNDDVAEHSVIASVSDRDGASDRQSFSIAVSNVNDSPAVALVSSFEEWESGQLMIEASASDSDGSIVSVEFLYSYNNVAWNSVGILTKSPYRVLWDTEAPIPGLAHNVWIKARATDDSVAHTDSDAIVISHIDNQPPVISHDYNGLWHKEDFAINMKADDAEGIGVANAKYMLNSGGLQEVSGQATVTVHITTEGNNNVLEYWSVDKLGNESSHEMLSSIKLDKTAPIFSDWQQDPVDLTEDTVGEFRLSVQVSDSGGSGLEGEIPQFDYHIGTETQYDGFENMESGSWFFDIAEPADTWDAHQGKYVYYKARVEDIAGNISETSELTELIDSVNDAPTVSIISVFEDWESGQITIEATASDIDGSMPIVQFDYSLDATNWTPIGMAVSAPPYSAIWDTTTDIPQSEKAVWIRATAIDADDSSISVEDMIPNSFGIDNQPATFGDWTTSPEDLTEGIQGSFRVSVNVDDDLGSGVAKVELSHRIDTIYYRAFAEMTRGNDNSWYYDIPEPSGTWDQYRGRTLYYTVKATDVVGNETPETPEQQELIDDINDPPRGLITSTYQDWERGSLIISANATDDDGQVTSVQFQYSTDNVDWINIDPVLTVEPYTATWDTTNISSAPEVWLRIVITDNKNATSEAKIAQDFGIDNNPPVFSDWNHISLTEDFEDIFRVEVQITDEDSGLDNSKVQLDYRIGTTGYTGYQNMFRETDNKWFYEIPEPVDNWSKYSGETLFYRVRAYDKTGNFAESDEQKELIDSINDPPEITSTAITTATEDEPYIYDVDATDPDVDDILTYSLTTSPSGMNINSSTGVITWTPTNSQMGDNSVIVAVSDGNGGSDTQSFTVIVSNVNHPPEITSAAITTAIVDKPYSYDVDAMDPDGDELTYTVSSPSIKISDSAYEYEWQDLNSNGIWDPGEPFRITGLGSMTIESSTGLLTWTPTDDDVGQHSVTVEVSDGNGGSDTQSFTVIVSSVNHPPEITSTAATTAKEDTVYSYDVDATDPDMGDLLTYSLTTSPSGMNIDSSTGVITWTPTDDDVGQHSVTVTVSDGHGGSDTQPFTVVAINVNHPPEITSIAATTTKENAVYSYDVDATDPDMGDVLTYSLTTSPSWMNINSSTGLVYWRPKDDDVGEHDITVKVSDGHGGSDTQSFTVIVSNVNDPPEITSTAATTATEDTAYIYDVDATDPDVGDVLTYSLTISPSGMNINSSTGVITWTPTDDDVGKRGITVKVSDGNGGSDTQYFTITVSGNADIAEMVLIPAGEFQMGDSFGEGQSDELPVHTVYLDAFYIDRYEVTNSQYAAFLNSYGKNTDDSGNMLLGLYSWGPESCLIEQVGGTYKAKPGYEDHPVVHVSWYGAKAYAEFYGRRLPTEAEWEKAARGGLVGKRYPWGDNIGHDDANYAGTGGRDAWSKTSPVGSFSPNGYGLYDMAGNVWEWCSDWYDADYYSSSPKNNPKGPNSDNDSGIVLRGGAWNSTYDQLRCAYRLNSARCCYPYTSPLEYVSFRCAK